MHEGTEREPEPTPPSGTDSTEPRSLHLVTSKAPENWTHLQQGGLPYSTAVVRRSSSYLSLLGLLQHKGRPLGGEDIDYSQFWSLGSPKSRPRQMLVRPSVCVPTVGGGRGEEALRGPFYKDINPKERAPPS